MSALNLVVREVPPTPQGYEFVMRDGLAITLDITDVQASLVRELLEYAYLCGLGDAVSEAA